jgi:acetyl-CoA carboxylase biotin carboxyl carrier protein
MAEKIEQDREQSTDAEEGVDYGELTQTVRDLVEIMRTGEIEKLELARGDLHIVLSKPSSNPAPTASVAPNPSDPIATPSGEASAPDDGVDYHLITSPMVGTFYEAPSPGASPFVNPGDPVEVGQTVAIIEAMKIMNEIVADRPGTVDEVLVENGEAVEYGHPLIRIRPS